jgi:hypothetical protein
MVIPHANTHTQVVNHENGIKNSKKSKKLIFMNSTCIQMAKELFYAFAECKSSLAELIAIRQ